jgi:ribosomal-protein-alanine N-acetyltransferase
MATLHARCFAYPRPWSATEFQSFLSDRNCVLAEAPEGFALGRVMADEAELLTIAVDPAQRRRGVGQRLLLRFHDLARMRGGATAFLEVAAVNTAAIALYGAAGYQVTGRRRDYYRRDGQSAVDAVTMARDL